MLPLRQGIQATTRSSTSNHPSGLLSLLLWQSFCFVSAASSTKIYSAWLSPPTLLSARLAHLDNSARRKVVHLFQLSSPFSHLTDFITNIIIFLRCLCSYYPRTMWHCQRADYFWFLSSLTLSPCSQAKAHGLASALAFFAPLAVQLCRRSNPRHRACLPFYLHTLQYYQQLIPSATYHSSAHSLQRLALTSTHKSYNPFKSSL